MELFTDTPAVAIRNHPEHAGSLRGLKRRGKLVSPLPGVYAVPDMPDTWQARLLCAHLWAPELTISGAAAAKALWWPDLQLDTIEMWGAKRKAPASWITVSRSETPRDFLVWQGDMPFASPALTVMQMARRMGGLPIDEALRRDAASLNEMRQALACIPHQDGNNRVRRLLNQSKHEPWSELEREGHVLLDRARITGWDTNIELWLDGERFYIDIGFAALKIAIELDGFRYHSDRASFERDRAKQNLLVLGGWTVLRYTSRTIHQMVPQLRQLAKARGIVLG